MDKNSKELTKCLVCRQKAAEVTVSQHDKVTECNNCGLYIEEGSSHTIVDFPQHEPVMLFTSLPRKIMRKRLFTLKKRITRARKAYNKRK